MCTGIPNYLYEYYQMTLHTAETKKYEPDMCVAMFFARVNVLQNAINN